MDDVEASVDELIELPPLLTGSFFFLGLVVITSLIVWLLKIARHGAADVSLRSYTGTQLLRACVILFVISAVMVMESGRIATQGLYILLPEAVFLSAFFVFALRRGRMRFENAGVLFILRREVLMIFSIVVQTVSFTALSAVLCGVAILLSGFSLNFQDAGPYMLAGTFWLGLIFYLYSGAVKKSATTVLHVQGILLALAFALFLIMIPGLLQLAINSEAMNDMLHPLPHLERV